MPWLPQLGQVEGAHEQDAHPTQAIRGEVVRRYSQASLVQEPSERVRRSDGGR